MIHSRILILFSCLSLAAQLSSAADLVITASVEPVAGYPSGAPIPNAQDVPFSRDFGAVYANWANRVIVGEYKRSLPDDADGVLFLEDAIRYLIRTFPVIENWYLDRTAQIFQRRGHETVEN